MRKNISVFLILLSLFLLVACSRDSQPKGPTISIRVEGISENLAFDAAYPLTQESSALSLVCGLLDDLDIPYDTDSGYLTAVANDKAGAFGGWDGFVLYLNGEESLASPENVLPKDGDTLLFCYADLSGEPPTLLPKIEATRGSDGLITLKILGGKLIFQGETPMMDYSAVADAEITVNEVLYHTDESGNLVLDEALSKKSHITLQVEHYTEDGKPLLIRLEPGFTLELPR